MPDAHTKPVIFLAFANDRDDTVGYLRNLPTEARLLREALEPAKKKGLCEIVERNNSTANDIFNVLQDEEYRNRIAIFHYGGHANGYSLLLESAAGNSAATDAGGLAAFFAQQQGLQLVFLNGCSTQEQTQGLLDANIPAVISTSRAIDDGVATDFAHRFYKGLAVGATIRTAYNEAEASVRSTKGGNTRGMYFGKAEERNQPEADRWPWNLYLSEGAESADQWNLPDAVDNPLFGLPPLPEQDLPESPYRHLHWFTRDDAEIFFGRGHQIRDLYDRLTAPGTAPIILFYGQSGVGKSSLLDAGLNPRLEPAFNVAYARRNEKGLLATLQSVLLPDALDTPIETAWQDKEQQTGKPLIVFLDQVEELYTRPITDMPDELEQLLHALKAIFGVRAGRPQGKLVLGFRKEWLAELEAQLIEYKLPRSKVFLEPLNRQGIVEVVQGPASSERLREQYGLVIEDGLAQIIAEDLLEDRDSAIAPTLQILLTKLWNKATEENYEKPFFSQALYQTLKRDGILLRDFLNQQIATFHDRYPELVDSGLLLDIVAMHTTALGTAGRCSQEDLQQQYAHMAAILPDLLQQCQDLYLLTVTTSTGKENSKTTRLAHDTLAPLVRERFDESDKPGQRARRILDNRSVDWAEEQVGTPLDEADLNVVEQGVSGTRALSATEERLLHASRDQRAKLQQYRQRNKLFRYVAVVLIAIAGVVGWIQWDRANESAKEVQRESVRAARNAYNAGLGNVRELLSTGSNGALTSLDGSANFPDNLREFTWGYHRRQANRQLKPLENPSGEVRSIAISADGMTLAAGTSALIKLYNTKTGKTRHNLIGHGQPVHSVAFSADGKMLASGSHDTTIKLWNVDTGENFATLGGHVGKVLTVAFSPDDKTLVSGGLDGKIRFWNADTGENLTTLPGHDGGVLSVVFWPDDKTLVSGGLDGTIRLWNVDNGENFATLAEPDGQVGSVAFSPDGKTFASGSNLGTIRLRNAKTRETRYTLIGHDDWVDSVAFSPDSKTLASGGRDKTIRLWSVDTGKSLATLTDGYLYGATFSLAFSADGKRLASGGNRGNIQLWNVDPAAVVTTLASKAGEDQFDADGFAFSTDGRTLAAYNSSGNNIRLWNGTTGEPRPTLTGHEKAILSTAFSPDGKTLASVSEDETIRLWNVDTGKPGAILTGRNGPVGVLVFWRDGKTLASVSREGTIRLWNTDTGEELPTIIENTNSAVHSFAFSPDGETLALGSHDHPEIGLWNVKTGDFLPTLKADASEVWAVAISPDGKTLASGGDNGILQLWDVETGETRASSDKTGYTVNSIAFSPDGKTLASGSADSTIMLWDVATGEPLATLTGHTDTVISVLFSSDGKTLISGGKDNTIRLWRSDWPDAKQAATPSQAD